jgi:hypothetical protein
MSGNIIFYTLIVLGLITSILFIFKDSVEEIYVGIAKNYRIKLQIKKFVEINDYLYLSKVVLRVQEGEYVIVDHIILGDRFIYVIASKFYYGYVNGKDIDAKWVVSDGATTNIVNNPFYANEVKIDYLSRIMNLSRDKFVNIVMLAKTAVVDNIEINADYYRLVNEKNVYSEVKKFEDDQRFNIFDPKDIEAIAANLFEYHKMSLEDKKVNGK